MKDRVFLSINQGGIIENYWMMHFFNVTDVLTNRVNCSGSTFNLTLFWRVVRDLRALLEMLWLEQILVTCHFAVNCFFILQKNRIKFCKKSGILYLKNNVTKWNCSIGFGQDFIRFGSIFQLLKIHKTNAYQLQVMLAIWGQELFWYIHTDNVWHTLPI